MKANGRSVLASLPVPPLVVFAGGTHRESGLVTVGAYAAEHASWMAFARGWSRRTREIKDHVDFGVAVSLRRQDFVAGSELLASQGPATAAALLSEVGGAFALCAAMCAYHLGREWLPRASAQPARFIFESSEPAISTLPWVFQGLARHLRVSVELARKVDAPQLDAVAFLAHARGSGNRKWFDRLRQATPLVDHVLKPGDAMPSLQADAAKAPRLVLVER